MTPFGKHLHIKPRTKNPTEKDLFIELIGLLDECWTRSNVIEGQFGLGITKFLFENITPEGIEQAKYLTREGITQYFPRIIINELNLTAYPDSNLLNLQMKYSIRETGIQDELTINFEQ